MEIETSGHPVTQSLDVTIRVEDRVLMSFMQDTFCKGVADRLIDKFMEKHGEYILDKISTDEFMEDTIEAVRKQVSCDIVTAVKGVLRGNGGEKE